MAGTELACDDHGRGPPLLLIHGFPLDRGMWRPQLEGLAGVARVVAPDLPGFGDSAAPPKNTMSMDDYAAELLRLIEHLGLQALVLAGLSMGGYIALAFMARYPERARGLILASTRAAADSAAARADRYRQAQAAARGPEWSAIAAGLVDRILAPGTRQRQPQLVAGLRAMMERQSGAGVAAALRGMAEREDRSDLLRSIKIPTLVIHGDADPLIAPAEGESLARAIPGAQLVVVPGAGHLPNLEAAQRFNAAVRSFLAGLG